MSIIAFLSNKLLLPEMRGVDVDSNDRIKIHRSLLRRKPIMKRVFGEFYSKCMALDKKFFSTKSDKIVELGAGSSPVKDFYPNVLTSDLVSEPHLDMVVDCQNMPFEDGSVRSIWGVNCFHHFPDPEKFFSELIRILEPGGGCILIDPYYGPLATKFFREFCDTETFNKFQKDWSDPERTAMTGANQALTYIVFKRDRKIFAEKFPELEIVCMKPLTNYLSYILSGGVNFVQLVPNSLSFLVRAAEFFLFPMSRLFALHHLIVIRKKK